MDSRANHPHTLIMAENLPAWATRGSSAQDDAECAEFAAMSPAERWQVLAQLCKLGATLLAANDRRELALALRDERSPESVATWRRLMARRHG
jgi:hypothetical protein